MSNIYPTLLAGGSGTRLWPLSRKSYPKQFSKILGEETLFQDSLLRSISSDKIKLGPVITLTSSEFRFIVDDQLRALGIENDFILIEPEAKNTAPPILAASLFIQEMDPEAILLVMPSDHIITNTLEFHTAVKIGLKAVNSGRIITFGVPPTYPETGYGYLQIKDRSMDQSCAHDVVNFVEKPEFAKAKKMLETNNALWNAGIFLFKVSEMISEFEKFEPETIKLIRRSVSRSKKDLGFIKLEPTHWKQLKNISIDYAIIEKSQKLAVVPFKSKWSDLGSWETVFSEGEKDRFQNVASGGSHAIDCTNTLLYSSSDSQQLVGLGLDDIIAIAMPDAVLVAKKNKAQEVKKVVNTLKDRNIPQAENFQKDYRPWGWFESLAVGPCFQVKRIFVNPNGSLSLQSHKYRSEHWIIVEGTAVVSINNKVQTINEGESIYVPIGAIHRLENREKKAMVLIEVQIGVYLGEDDIIRYEDAYSRN